MKYPATQYKRHRFPAEITQHAVWLYYRFNLSDRDIEDTLARRRDAAAARLFFRHVLAHRGGDLTATRRGDCCAVRVNLAIPGERDQCGPKRKSRGTIREIRFGIQPYTHPNPKSPMAALPQG
jgi:hypothetical protein